MKPDLFAEARAAYTIPDAWQMLRLPGEPKASCKSPFRDERSPSFTIFDNGRAWKDHGTGDGGDVVEFIRHAIGGDHRAVRDWLKERIGIDYYDFDPGKAPLRLRKPATPAKPIQWPAELIEGTSATWKAFADLKGLRYSTADVLVRAGILRFCKMEDGTKCFVITDAARRSAEIRRLDGKTFGESKAFPLRGVNKSWPVGCDLIRYASAESSVLIVEGATDLLTAIDLYTRYRREECGSKRWVPVAILGAGCKALAPEAEALIRGRHCRIVPDADPAGDQMAEHWSALLRSIGCTVDVVDLPRGTDLTDCKNSIHPFDLFSL